MKIIWNGFRSHLLILTRFLLMGLPNRPGRQRARSAMLTIYNTSVMFPSRELNSHEKKSAGPFDIGSKQQDSCTWTSLTRRAQGEGLHTEGRHNVDE
ncbi:hypothetical protein AVEN_38616-1 [Araneus ventricosus]|uniref:Secreted protein n=1 Tax=Araneus ventricosus TaxID=182803 RepID=A0A4Y2N016_ARAVE|nr:hypothetical protein AVEN_38616-1 [Araneus ventricosus]